MSNRIEGALKSGEGKETNVSAWCRYEARRSRVCSRARERGMPCENDSEDERWNDERVMSSA